MNEERENGECEDWRGFSPGDLQALMSLMNALPDDPDDFKALMRRIIIPEDDTTPKP